MIYEYSLLNDKYQLFSVFLNPYQRKKNNIFMKKILFYLLAGQLCFTGAFAQEGKKAISWQDIPDWSFMRTQNTAYAPDGKWLATVAGPTQGDLSLTLKRTLDTTSYTYAVGGQASNIQFNEDSKFVAFTEAIPYKTIKANQKAKKPSDRKLRIVQLSDTASTTFERVQSFGFANEGSDWLGIRFANDPAVKTAAKGSDLLIYNVKTKKSFNLGNVSEHSANKAGNLLAYTVDANGQNGNGVFLLDLASGQTSALQNDKATFEKLAWNKEGTAFTLLKSKKDKNFKKPVYSIIGVKNINGDQTEVLTFNGLDEDKIASGFGISENSTPSWSKDLNRVFFGIAPLEKSDDAKKKESSDSTATKIADNADSTANNKLASTDSIPKKTAEAKPKAKDLEKPDMMIWNWQDERLQPEQQKALTRDKNFNMMSVIDFKNNKFTSLADSNIRSIALSPDQLIGYGYDMTPYQYESNLNGQAYADVYIVNIATGEKKLALSKYYLNPSRGFTFSPNSQNLLFYNDGAFHIMDVNTLAVTNVTANIPAKFFDNKADHNVEKVATPNFGWTQDGNFVLIRDNNDLWKVAKDGKKFTQLTNNWKSNKYKVNTFFRIYPDDEFIDLKKDQYLAIFDDATKQAGFARLEANKNQIQVLSMEEASMMGLRKAKHGNQFFYTKASSTDAPEIFTTTNKDLAQPQQLTTNTAGVDKYAISAGVKLINYVNNYGDTLQASLFLPANYVEGQSYPTITYIYERLTDGTHSFANPGFPGGGFNRAVYTSNGYAVLMPDITYKLNDPGMSAVACVIPAVEAAIATGVVDADNVGLHGHSWGGYQTAFLITQTNMFKASVAGAPLTNLISMYSLMYWNSGSSNQSIFESSQARLTSGYWDNWEAYTRNSPIYHIKNVKTPLLLMHNDKDGAVDYTQGVEYFNGLRRLNKPVVMLSYTGENHGLAKEVNQKDYAVRMMEYFDHFLKQKESPDWWAKGIKYIDLEKHLEDRAF